MTISFLKKHPDENRANTHFYTDTDLHNSVCWSPTVELPSHHCTLMQKMPSSPKIEIIQLFLQSYTIYIYYTADWSVWYTSCIGIKCIFVCLSVCLSICLSIHLSVRLTIYPSIHLSACPSVCLSITLFVWLSTHLSVCRSIHLSVCLCI